MTPEVIRARRALSGRPILLAVGAADARAYLEEFPEVRKLNPVVFPPGPALRAVEPPPAVYATPAAEADEEFPRAVATLHALMTKHPAPAHARPVLTLEELPA